MAMSHVAGKAHDKGIVIKKYVSRLGILGLEIDLLVLMGFSMVVSFGGWEVRI